MSHEGLTEETKAILKSLETDDAKANIPKEKESQEKPSVKDKEVDDGIDWETNTEEDADLEW